MGENAFAARGPAGWPDDPATLGEETTRVDGAMTPYRPGESGVRSVVALREGITPVSQGAVPCALRDAERVRLRLVFWVVSALAGAGILRALLRGGDPIARTVMVVGLLLAVAAVGWGALCFRAERRPSDPRVTAAILVCVAAVLGTIYYAGVFSPAAALFPFAFFVVGLGQSRRSLLVAAATGAVAYLGLALGVVSGVLADRGLAAPGAVPATSVGFMVGMVEAAIVASSLLAMASRQAIVRAVARRDEAVRALAQHELMLAEARRDLEDALRAARVGRFTDEELGSYRLGELIGEGGMGEVYHARHLGSGKRAAVKILRRDALCDPVVVRRFVREAKIMRGLRVPNVVQVYEVGVDAPTPYIAMERLVGADLREVLGRERSLGLGVVATLANDVATGLGAVHDAGIIHRDIKPTNLFLADIAPGRRTWKLLDFGISKLLTSCEDVSQNAVLGTPAYMAPEQVRGQAVTPASDVFSLGAVCYRALTGRAPFEGSNVPAVLSQLVSAMPCRPSALGPHLPPEIDDVLAIALAKEPSDRFATPRQLADAIAQAARGKLDARIRWRARVLLARQPFAAPPAAERPVRCAGRVQS